MMFTDQKLKEYNDREERFKKAIEEAQTNKTASINSIANRYKVSRTTLSRRIHGFKNTRTSHEKQQKFTNDEELLIIQQINNLLKISSTIPPKKEILSICEELLKSKYANQPPHENENFFKVGKNWIDRFLERHNDKLMINDSTSLCEYYKHEFLQRKKLRSNREFKSENSSPAVDDRMQHHYPHPHQEHHHQQFRPLMPEYMTNSNMEQVVMNMPNGFVIPNLMPQNSFNQENQPPSWNQPQNLNSVPMKHSMTGLSNNQSMNFHYPQPLQTQSGNTPQQQSPGQLQQQQPQLARGISNISGFGPNSILNNHGVHLNGNAVVNIYPENRNGPPTSQQQTPVSGQGTPTTQTYGNHGLNNYALQQQQQQQTKPEFDPLEFFQNQRFQYDSARMRILTELDKTELDSSYIKKLVSLSFEQFAKESNSGHNTNAAVSTGGYLSGYQ